MAYTSASVSNAHMAGMIPLQHPPHFIGSPTLMPTMNVHHAGGMQQHQGYPSNGIVPPPPPPPLTANAWMAPMSGVPLHQHSYQTQQHPSHVGVSLGSSRVVNFGSSVGGGGTAAPGLSTSHSRQHNRHLSTNSNNNTNTNNFNPLLASSNPNTSITNSSGKQDKSEDDKEKDGKSQNQQLYRNLYLSGLPQNINDDDLKEFFGAYGKIESAKVMIDVSTGMSRGFAFVLFSRVEEGCAAFGSLNGKDVTIKGETFKMKMMPSEHDGLSATLECNTIYVRNIPASLSDDVVLKHFMSFGKVVSFTLRAIHPGKESKRAKQQQKAAALAAAAAAAQIDNAPKGPSGSIGASTAAATTIEGHVSFGTSPTSHQNGEIGSSLSNHASMANDANIVAAALAAVTERNQQESGGQQTEGAPSRNTVLYNMATVEFETVEQARAAIEGTHYKRPWGGPAEGESTEGGELVPPVLAKFADAKQPKEGKKKKDKHAKDSNAIANTTTTNAPNTIVEVNSPLFNYQQHNPLPPPPLPINTQQAYVSPALMGAHSMVSSQGLGASMPRSLASSAVDHHHHMYSAIAASAGYAPPQGPYSHTPHGANSASVFRGGSLSVQPGSMIAHSSHGPLSQHQPPFMPPQSPFSPASHLMVSSPPNPTSMNTSQVQQPPPAPTTVTLQQASSPTGPATILTDSNGTPVTAGSLLPLPTRPGDQYVFFQGVLLRSADGQLLPTRVDQCYYVDAPQLPPPTQPLVAPLNSNTPNPPGPTAMDPAILEHITRLLVATEQQQQQAAAAVAASQLPGGISHHQLLQQVQLLQQQLLQMNSQQQHLSQQLQAGPSDAAGGAHGIIGTGNGEQTTHNPSWYTESEVWT